VSPVQVPYLFVGVPKDGKFLIVRRAMANLSDELGHDL
jgi:hypothetical protein